MGTWAKRIRAYLSEQYTIKQRQWLYEALEWFAMGFTIILIVAYLMEVFT